MLKATPPASRVVANASPRTNRIARGSQGKQSGDELSAEDAQAKAALLPEGKPPEEVLRWINDHGTCQATLDDEKEHKRALAWLKAALLLAHKDADTKQWIKRLLAVQYFTANMGYMKIFPPLQDFCAE